MNLEETDREHWETGENGVERDLTPAERNLFGSAIGMWEALHRARGRRLD